MFPIRDHNPSSTTPYVSYGLIALNVLIFFSYQGLGGENLASFYENYAVIPAHIVAGQDLGTLLSHMFLHGGWMHLGGNMLFLYIFGDNLEHRFGHIKFLLFYLACGLGAAFAQILMQAESTIPSLGASGAIAGVMGGYLWLYPNAKVDTIIPLGIVFKRVTLPAFTMLGYWFFLQLYSGTLSIGLTGGGVAYWAHTGGFVVGFLLTLILSGKKRLASPS